MAQTKWTGEQQDEFLDLVLPCNNQEEYQRALVQFGARYGRSAELSLDEGENWLRRRAKCRSVYAGLSTYKRMRRTNLPFSYVENKILDWADNWHTESSYRPTALELSLLLHRSISEVEKEIENRRTSKAGMENLF